MKKLFFFLAALMFSFAAHATVVECAPNTNAISWWLTQGDTLVLADGEYVEDYSITFDKPGVCVKAAEGAKPVIKLTGEWTDFSITATTTFDGITFDGGGVAKYFLATTGAESGTLTVVNCVFRNWAYWAISNQFETAASVDAVIVDNCLFHDGQGAAIRFSDKAPEGKHACNYLKVTNSTFYNIAEANYAAVIQANSNGEATGEQNEVIIDHITLYNFDASQLGAISMRKSSKLSITNSIIATPENKDQYAFYIYGGNVENTLYFNGKAKSGPTYTNCIEGQDPLFVDAANGDFTLAEGSPAIGASTDGSNLGDPRWNKSTTVDPEVLPAASVRAWAYDLALSVEGEQYTFSYKATTAAKATLIFADAEGIELATKDLGIVEAGANTVVIAASELPADKEVNWAVKLEAGAIAEIVEVTDQSRGIYDFYNMMDVLVDNNPESENFGKIYIQQSLNGASDGATDRADNQLAGFFVYDQELNELNPTSNVGIQPVLPEGYTMGDARNKFHRLEIDPKTGNLTWCYNMAGQPAVFAVDPANLAGEATNLVAGIEGLSRTSAHCFDADGALYVYNLPGAGSIFKIVDGVATEFVAADSKWVQASATMAADGKGGLWVAQNRGQIDTYYQLAHYTNDGVLDYAVYQGSENGFTGSSTRGALAYDVERQLLAQGRNGVVEVYSVVYDAETGVPTLTLVAATPTVGSNIDGIHFDYAGDLYVVNSSKEKFQKFAMPTDNNVCTTPAASKYAFQIGGEPVEYTDITMTDLAVTDMGTYTLLEASDAMSGIAVVLGVDAEGKLVEGSAVDWNGMDMPIVSSDVFTKTYSEELASDVYTGKLVIDFMGGLMGLNLTMYTIPVETIEVTIENAEVVVDLDWSELSYTANWTYEDVTYPVSVLLYGYDEEETEYNGMQIAELQIGGDGDDDPWLDYAVAEEVVVVKEGNVITLTGEFSSYATGDVYALTISGSVEGSAVENIQLDVNTAKMIKNGQLIIVKDGVEYNVQGAVIK